MILLDTNILLRSKQPNSEHYSIVTQKLTQFTTQGLQLLICPQVVYEFYAVLTRPPKNNGLGYSNSEANKEVDNLLQTYGFIDENGITFKKWKDLILSFDISGKKVHDAKLVAFMQANGINKIFTLNISDFSRYKDFIQFA